MSKESKLIDEGEIRKNILDKAANKILALPFPEQAVFHLYPELFTEQYLNW